MEDHVTLQEIYVYDATLFKTRNLRCFIKHHNIPENDVVKLKGAYGVKKSWVKKYLTSFNLKLSGLNDQESINLFEVQPTLEKYGQKRFNPVGLGLNSTMVKYFQDDGRRVPYFTRKGLIKVMVFFNDLPDDIYSWIYELGFGSLRPQLKNLENTIEMVNLNHVPIIKNINNHMVLSNHIYNINKNDIVVDFKRVADLKKEKNLDAVVESYKCPLFTQLQLNFQKSIEEVEKIFSDQVKDLKQEKVIQHLKQELDKEKSLKDQVLSLTQSFMPPIKEASPSPSLHPQTKVLSGFIKPSKIH